MQLPNYLTTVTPISKALAMIFFVTFPIIGFILGVKYQQGITPVQYNFSLPVRTKIEKSKINVVSPTSTILPTPTPINNMNSSWIKTTVMGRGIIFEYPNGWHVTGGVQIAGINLGQEKDYDAYLLSHEPITISTGEGPLADILISVKNGSSNPDEDFQNKLSEVKRNLVEIKEEKLSSDYFGAIYHITGKISRENPFNGGAIVEKYLFMSANSKYASKDIMDKNIIVVDIRGRDDIVKPVSSRLILSFKECHWTYCEDIFK